MTLYEINAELEKLIANSIDPETGELMIDPEQIDALNMARDEKIEQTALYIKNLKAEADAIKTEIDNLKARHDAAKNKAERLTAYIKDILPERNFRPRRWPSATAARRRSRSTPTCSSPERRTASISA